MKKFKSHKVVEAAKIVDIKVGNEKVRVTVGDGLDEHYIDPHEFLRFSHTPEDLGYLVRYPDGYVSWSPTKAFEEGYTEDGEPAAIPASSPFGYLKPTDAQLAAMEKLRAAAAAYCDALVEILPDGPDKTFAIRNHRTTAMWANVALTRQPDGSPRA